MARDGAKLLAVLIDADNVLSRHAEAILKEVGRIGEPALRRVYGDWSSSQLAGWKSAARDLGLVEPGYRLLANIGGHGHQEVPHLHVHLFGGKPLGPMLARFD